MKRIPVQVYIRNDAADKSPPFQAQISIDESTGLINYYSKGDSREGEQYLRTVEITRKNNSFGISIKGGDRGTQLGSAPDLPTGQFLGSGQWAVGSSTVLPCTAPPNSMCSYSGQGEFWAVFRPVLDLFLKG
ncbi:unnamed protein product [Oikopleura dioica]|uniref:Uncharacterized protein n=1 Tax=Oikopleura dioica TaxID=34765 RepID=E4YEN6_OIKDI|nr:unnamed protein product [Oikopleura dioica]